MIPAKPFLMSVALKGMLIMLYPVCLFLTGFLHKEELEKIGLLIRMRAVKKDDS
jgi:hypothetical protein